MARLNLLNLNLGPRTHEGAPARHVSPELQLRRSVLSCLLWESQFYEDGVEIAGRIAELVPKVAAEKVAALAVEAREKMKLLPRFPRIGNIGFQLWDPQNSTNSTNMPSTEPTTPRWHPCL
jgi:hypothetical protein